ncbi:MAG: PQQ-binding-like beta-propeller repeat protein [Paracoccaceae bacterium]|nr:PQQ-binding-like beta-propeller repeat protein [Paracoccaceae bacterium]
MIRRGVLIALLTLAACSEPEFILDGERLDVRGNPIPEETVSRTLPITLPPSVRNGSWTHPGGNASHHLAHVALDTTLNLAWSVPIGEGNDRKHRITADPVIADGRVYVMDSRARLSAFTTGGSAVWSTDLTPADENADEGSGGGIAVSGGRVYATSGFGELNVLDGATGSILWKQDLDAAATGAPMVSDGVVYVMTTNAIGWAISAEKGRILWQVLGATSSRSSTGGPSPAVAGPLVVFPFSSGQMVSAVAGTGAQAWAASVAGQRLGRAFGVVTDLTGPPLFADNRVYAASQAGRSAAFDATTGQSIWRADEGALGPLWLSGGSLFFVSDKNQLLRLDAATGETVWATDLPFFTRERIRRRKSIYLHHGPVLASGRLIVASDDGVLRQFDPRSGALIGSTTLPDGAARNPVVAGGILFVVTENGQLHAFR